MRGDGLFLVFSLQESDDGRRQRAVVVFLRVLNTFKSFRRQKQQKNQILEWSIIPVYGVKPPRLWGQSSPFMG
jgi:hypothetical protein